MNTVNPSDIAAQLPSLLTFPVGPVRCALPLLEVQQIVQDTTVTLLPRQPDFVLGLYDHRGTFVPILDTARRLSLEIGPAASVPPCFLIAETPDSRTRFVGLRILGAPEILRPKAMVDDLNQLRSLGLSDHSAVVAVAQDDEGDPVAVLSGVQLLAAVATSEAVSA